jgi:hypothetical protein
VSPRPHAEALAERGRRAQHEVCLVYGDFRVGAVEFEASAGGRLESQSVVERNRLEDRADFVVAVGAATQHAQAEVDLGEGRERESVR